MKRVLTGGADAVTGTRCDQLRSRSDGRGLRIGEALTSTQRLPTARPAEHGLRDNANKRARQYRFPHDPGGDYRTKAGCTIFEVPANRLIAPSSRFCDTRRGDEAQTQHEDSSLTAYASLLVN